jgi:hypothetical protein
MCLAHTVAEPWNKVHTNYISYKNLSDKKHKFDHKKRMKLYTLNNILRILSDLKLSMIYFKLLLAQNWSSKNYIFYHITHILKREWLFLFENSCAVFLEKKEIVQCFINIYL